MVVATIIDELVNWIMGLPPALVLLVAFAFPALEASVFVGVIIPGEVAVLMAGVVANGGEVNIVAVIAAACLGAVIGDFIGFEVGKHWGDRLLAAIPERIVKPAHVERSKAALRKRGPIAIIFGRWVAALRALMPGIAGMSGIRTGVFIPSNIVGGCTWAATIALLGYAAGSQYEEVEAELSTVSTYALIAIGVAAVAYVGFRVLRGRGATGDVG